MRLAVILLLLFALQANAQKETTWWMFGNRAGLEFDSTGPQSTMESVADQYWITGTGSYSDKNGELLFYTEGDTIWDKSHNPMPNGTGLIGMIPSEQPVAIVPHPGNSDQYFLFMSSGAAFMTSSTQPNIGLYYHIFDMSLNGGLGDVVSSAKNVVVIDSVEEKIAFGCHGNMKDYWLYCSSQ